MKNIFKIVKPVWCLWLPLIAASAFADTGDWRETGPVDMPSYQLSGWFFNPTADPFPTFSDPSLQWTTDDNIALINHWLSVVAEMANDPSAGAPAPDADALALSEGQSQSGVPEPATWSLFCAGLALLVLGAVRRGRKPAVQHVRSPVTY